MVAISEDFLVCDDMDAILSLIEEDIAWEDENFVVEVNNIVGQLNETTPDSRFPCELCEKVCKSQHGLTRHKNTKHQQQTIDQQIPTTSSTTVNSEIIAEEKLRPLYFMKYVNESAIKLSKDECYSQTTRFHFEGYKLSLDEAYQAYKYVREVIYPKYYNCVSSENSIFRNLPRRSSVILD